MHKDARIFIGMTTIPPRLQDPKFVPHLLCLNLQFPSFEKLFLTLPKSYKRFPNETLNRITLARIQNLKWLEIIWLDEDYGPACKFLGPMIHKYDILKDNILIILDDDRFYDRSMIEIYKNFFNIYPHIKIVSGNPFFYFNQLMYNSCNHNYIKVLESHEKYPSGFMSFAMHFSFDWKPLIEYTLHIIKHVDKAFYHDEGILLNFIRFLNISLFYIDYKFVNVVKEEMVNSLVNGNYIDRKEMEEKIMQYTNKNNLLGVQYSHYNNKKIMKKINRLPFYILKKNVTIE